MTAWRSATAGDPQPVAAAEAVEGGLDPYPDESVCAMFERQASLTPDSVAVICEGRATSYQELDRQVSRLARYLRLRRGIGPEDVVALLLDRTERMLVSMLAVLKAGGAYLPLSADYPPNRIASILADAQPALLIAEDPGAAAAIGYTEALICWSEADWTGESAERLPDDPPGGDLAYIMFTSGSTGRPKGVMVEHRNLANFIQWCRCEYERSTFDIVYAGTPYGFDLSNIELFFPLTVGKPIRLLMSSQSMALFLRRDRNVLINTVPSLVQELLKTEGILANVSVLNLGGEAVQPSLIRELRACPGIEVRNMYGPTETTSTAINHRFDLDRDDILIGTPIANVVVHILDDGLRPVPRGERGEICIGGRGVTRGYCGRPELTRERFVEDPLRAGERIYRSGDIGMFLADGTIRCFGRTDNQVKVRGYRVELEEIANRLTLHPGICEAMVGLKGAEGEKRLVAFVRLADGETDTSALAGFLREHLPPYMIPETFIAVEELPLTPTGKADRSALFEGRPPLAAGWVAEHDRAVR
jgi:amino acid adenylation domain-containing protein